MKIICTSDTHGRHNLLNVPEGDVFIHAGDFTMVGAEEEVRSFSNFLKKLPHKYKIVIAGNHDVSFETNPVDAKSWLDNSCIYLESDGIEIEGVKFWGSPWTPWISDRWAFQGTTKQLSQEWQKIPTETDVLITHTPPNSILDKLAHNGAHIGSADLTTRSLLVVKPKIHIFGHIHESSGIENKGETLFINASMLNERYEPNRECFEIIL